MEVIPMITHPLGRYWEQPSRDQITIEHDKAYMTQATLDQLAGYHSSNPSGIYEGKMWRRQNTLVWYGPCDKPDCCSINSRIIVIVDELCKD